MVAEKITQSFPRMIAKITQLFPIMTDKTRQSKHCGFSIYIFDNSKSIMNKVKINGQVGQGEEDGLVKSGLC